MTRQDGWKFGASYFGLEICIELVGHFPGACLIGRALRFHHFKTQGSEIRLIALTLAQVPQVQVADLAQDNRGLAF